MVMSAIKRQYQGAVAAFSLLTRIPMPGGVPFDKAVLTKSVHYFPLAGLAIGLLIGAASWLLPAALPEWPSAVLLLSLWIGLSGGLHLDGWMDTADGVLSHRSRERMLDIMKDSRVGAMGVIAAILLLLLKASLLAHMMGGSDSLPLPLFIILVLCAVWSRAWMAVAIAGWRPARPNEGLGAMFQETRLRHALGAMAAAFVISFIILIINDINYIDSLLVILVAIGATALTGGGMAIWLNRKLGGLTGDTYGAMNEAVEAALLVAVVAWGHMGGALL